MKPLNHKQFVELLERHHACKSAMRVIKRDKLTMYRFWNTTKKGGWMLWLIELFISAYDWNCLYERIQLDRGIDRTYLLYDLYKCLEENKKQDAKLAEYLRKLYPKPWEEYDRGDVI